MQSVHRKPETLKKIPICLQRSGFKCRATSPGYYGGGRHSGKRHRTSRRKWQRCGGRGARGQGVHAAVDRSVREDSGQGRRAWRKSDVPTQILCSFDLVCLVQLHEMVSLGEPLSAVGSRHSATCAKLEGSGRHSNTTASGTAAMGLCRRHCRKRRIQDDTIRLAIFAL